MNVDSIEIKIIRLKWIVVGPSCSSFSDSVSEFGLSRSNNLLSFAILVIDIGYLNRGHCSRDVRYQYQHARSWSLQKNSIFNKRFKLLVLTFDYAIQKFVQASPLSLEIIKLSALISLLNTVMLVPRIWKRIWKLEKRVLLLIRHKCNI